MRMARHIRAEILDRDGLTDGGTGRSTTAAKEVLRLVSILQATIERPDIAPTVLFPTEGEETIEEAWNDRRPFLIVLAAPNARKIVREWGQRVVGLDGLYKATRYGLPLYALVASDTDGHTWPIAMALGDGDWRPIVMIDKDARERAAIVALGLEFVLCDFHVQQAWRRATTRLSKDWDDALAKLKRTGGPGFFAYFTANWLGDDWRSGWSDLLRVLNRKKAASPDSLVLTIVLGQSERRGNAAQASRVDRRSRAAALRHRKLPRQHRSWYLLVPLPTWLRCISPTIFCDPTVFSDNDEGRCEALGITGPPGRPPTLEPRPRRRRKNQLLQHRAGSGDVDLHGGGGSGPGRIEATSHT